MRDWILLVLRVLSPLVLYTFLGTIIYRVRKTGVPVSARLVAAENPAQVWRLSSETTIGRDAANTIAIDDAFASARHARLVWRDGGWWLEDTGSTNGTRLNNTRLSAPTPLHPGDIIVVGTQHYRFEQE